MRLTLKELGEILAKDWKGHEDLQVRVAGWNVRWNEIPKKEQDGFIRRLEAMPE